MNKNVSVLIASVIFTAISLTVFSPRVVYADGGATAAALIAFAIKEGVFDCAAHLGDSQCKSLDRCNRTLAVLGRAKAGSETAAKELDHFINDDGNGMQKNCARSLQGGNFSALITNLEALRNPPVPSGCPQNKIFTTVNGQSCVLEWAGGKGNPVGSKERLAKFDCDPNTPGDPMRICKFGSASVISTIAEDNGNEERCSLEFNGVMGSVSGINPDESVAKFDCDPNTPGDPIFISNNRISTIIEGKECFLEWSAAFGGPQVGAKEKAAKWDCGSQGEPMDIR